MSHPSPEPSVRANRTRVFLGSGFGNFTEWYDFSVYGLVAVYLGGAFFPAEDPGTQLLSTFAVFGVAFLVRPFGALYFGPLADRIGRKRVLVIVLTLMAASTVLVGLIPTYDTIGIAAPILLLVLRSLQGFSAAGEFGSNVTFLTEHAGARRRGLGAAVVTISSNLGLLAGIVFVWILTSTLGADVMAAWGWRIPFLVAGPLGMVGLYIRSQLEDSAEFRELVKEGREEAAPLRATVRQYFRPLLLTAGIAILYAVSYYFVATYLSSFVNVTAKLGPSIALATVCVACGVSTVAMLVGGLLADRFGGRVVLIVATVIVLIGALPAFLLLTSGSVGLVIIGGALLGLPMGLYLPPAIALISALFPTEVRGTGISVGFSIPIALFGGLSPLIATWLVGATSVTISPSWYLLAAAVASAVALASIRRGDLRAAPAPAGVDVERTGSVR